MYEKGKISIIIPLYNNEKYIKDCIDSVLKQSYNNFEIIIIDDGSLDQGYHIVKCNYSSYDNIKIVKQENSGPSSARNKGIQLANGEWILFLDSDDCLAEDSMKVFIQDSKSFDMVVAGWQGNYEIKSEYYGPRMKCILEGDEIRDLISYLISNGTLYKYNSSRIPSIEGPVAKLYSTKIIKENNIKFPEDICYAEDVVFNFKYLQQCKAIQVIPKVLYEASRHEDSLSNKKKNLVNIFNSFEQCIIIANKLNLDVEKQLLQRKFVWLVTDLEENAKYFSLKEMSYYFKENKISQFKNLEINKLSLFKKIEYFSMKTNYFSFYIILKLGILLKSIKKGWKYE